MSTSTLLSVPSVTRDHCGFDQYLDFNNCNQLQESGLLVIDKAFKDFDKATNEQMALPFAVLQQLAEPMPETIALCVSYSRKNAAIFKGYLLDIVEAYKAAGYEHFTSLHLPYEAYGTPMVGSVLMLVFSKTNFAYVPVKQTVMPAEAFPALRYHAPNGRSSGSIHAGTALMNGFYHSDKSFIPELGTWSTGVLRCEYQEGDYTLSEPLRRADINKLFGVSQHAGPSDLALCTPPTALATLFQLKYLPNPGDAPGPAAE